MGPQAASSARPTSGQTTMRTTMTMRRSTACPKEIDAIRRPQWPTLFCAVAGFSSFAHVASLQPRLLRRCRHVTRPRDHRYVVESGTSVLPPRRRHSHHGLEPVQHLSAHRRRRVSTAGVTWRTGDGLAQGSAAVLGWRPFWLPPIGYMRGAAQFSRRSRAAGCGAASPPAAQAWVSTKCPTGASVASTRISMS